MSVFKFLASLAFVFALVGLSQAGDFDYSEVIEKSLLFYEAQRSGKLPSNNRIPWRGDSMLTDSDGSIDLSGGYHDAGDYVKFNFPQASALTALAFGGIDFRAGYESAGQLGYLRDALKWGADYYIKVNLKKKTFYSSIHFLTILNSVTPKPMNFMSKSEIPKLTTTLGIDQKSGMGLDLLIKSLQQSLVLTLLGKLQHS
jgi:hypothetical protein